jgi:ferredoxin
VAGVGRCGFCRVSVSGGGTGAIVSATDREPAEEGFEEEGEHEGGDSASM